MQTQSNPPALADAILVVIGGTTGLGLSAARAFLGAGARGVVVTGRSAESAHAAQDILGDRAQVLAGDACQPAHAEQAIELAVKTFGGFHGLYHVAGGSGRRMGDGPLHEVTEAGIGATLELNLHSVILSNRAAVRQFRAQKSP